MVGIPPLQLSLDVAEEVSCLMPLKHGGKARGFPALAIGGGRSGGDAQATLPLEVSIAAAG